MNSTDREDQQRLEAMWLSGIVDPSGEDDDSGCAPGACPDIAERQQTALQLARSRRARQAVLTVATAVSARSGTAFLEQLASSMAQALGAHAAFVARALPGNPGAARTIASVVDGAITANFEYSVEGAPCAELEQADQCIVPDKLDRLYPASPLGRFGGRSYVGKRLVGSAGQHVGHLFVLFRHRLEHSDFILTALRIFAGRAAAELERQDTDDRVREQASLLEKARDAIIVCGLDYRIVYWNKGAERLYGWSASEAVGRSQAELLHDEPDAFRSAIERLLRVGEWRGEATQRRRDGTPLIIERHWTLVTDEQGEAQSILSINTDISQRKAAEREIQHLAFYDALTRLPNRQLLVDRLRHVLTSNARSGRAGALLFIDLDNFKTLNDTLGHDVGDHLLQQVALRLAACVRESDTVARLGGDEFVVVLDDLSENRDEAAAHARTVGEKILAALNQPYELSGYEYHSTPSIGITVFMNPHESVDVLLKRADLAMYQAKASGCNTVRFFDPAMQTAIAERASMEGDLRRALRKEEFRLHYQPQVDRDGVTTGAEALLRWEHPRLGLLSPASFIALAEDTGLILPLGYRVLEIACAGLREWANCRQMTGLSLSINISARQFRHPAFVAQVLSILNRTGIDPRQLRLELTESALAGSLDEVVMKMTALKARGVGFSLEGFGTGYTSLAYLKRLPLDQLKIDQSFVSDVLTDPSDAVIARTIVALGHSLGLSVIAEGVETEAQCKLLARHGCRAFQGNLFSPPLPPEQYEAFVQGRAADKEERERAG